MATTHDFFCLARGTSDFMRSGLVSGYRRDMSATAPRSSRCSGGVRRLTATARHHIGSVGMSIAARLGPSAMTSSNPANARRNTYCPSLLLLIQVAG